MGANTSQVSDLSENQSLLTLIGTESISDNDPFWNQLISFTFISPTSSGNSKLLEEAVIPLAKILIENNPRTGNFGALVRIFLGRTKELKISTECQDQLFIWQAHNTLFMIRCLLKVFIREMTEEELHLQFSYQERVPGSCDTGSKVLLEELMCNLVYLVVEVPLLDITYSILFESVTTMLVLLSYQLSHKEILRDGLIYRYLMKGRCLSLTSQLVKTLLYNFIRQEKCPPPATHIFEQQSEGGGLLYGLASGVASGLWSVFALGGAGSKPGLDQEQNPLPLSNQSLLLLLVLANLTDGPNNCPNPYRQAVTCFKNTQDTSSIPTEQHHTFQINFNSLYTALCEQQRSDQATLILYTLLHQNTNMRTYMLSRTDMENLWGTVDSWSCGVCCDVTSMQVLSVLGSAEGGAPQTIALQDPPVTEDHSHTHSGTMLEQTNKHTHTWVDTLSASRSTPLWNNAGGLNTHFLLVLSRMQCVGMLDWCQSLLSALCLLILQQCQSAQQECRISQQKLTEWQLNHGS